MEREEIFDVVEDAVSKAFSKHEAEEIENPQMMAIQAFDAFNELDEPVRVVGVINTGTGLDFVVIREDPDGDGEIYPSTAGGVYRKKTTDSAALNSSGQRFRSIAGRGSLTNRPA